MELGTARLLIIILAAFGAGCVTVKATQRAVLADPIMQFEGDPQASQQYRHAVDNREGSYGGGATINFAPSWPICPFLGIGGGGLSVRPNADSFVLKREDLYLARAGGGILMALRGRILVRMEVTNLTLFAADTFKNAQTYSVGFGVYF